MRRTFALAITAALLLVPSTLLAQDETVADVDAADEVTTYACVAVTAAPGEDPTLAILSGDFEVVDNEDCLSSEVGQVVAAFEPLVFGAKGERKTKPFTLPEGDYEFVVKFKGRKDSCRNAEVGLNSIDEGYSIEDFEGSDYAYGIEAGRYFLEGLYMDKTCAWTVRIAEFAE